jgi:hypothetical protein
LYHIYIVGQIQKMENKEEMTEKNGNLSVVGFCNLSHDGDTWILVGLMACAVFW